MSPRSPFAQLGRTLRTLRHLRPRQALAQVVHRTRGPLRPAVLAEPAPALHVRKSAVPFLPAPAHARLLGRRRLELLNREVEFGSDIDWDHASEGPLWAYHLHQFDFLRGPQVSPALRGEWMRDWVDHCRGGAGWDPHPLCLRTLAWGKLLATPGALAWPDEAERRVLHSLACQVETLARHPEVHLQANHLLSNWLGVVFAGLLFEGARAETWLARERELRREIALQILPDGLHCERSPMYHSLLLENLLDLLNLARATPQRAPAALVATLEDATARMLGALAVLVHPDGEIALFADSAFGIGQPPERLLAYAAALGVSPRSPQPRGVLADAGYARLESGGLTLIASLAGPMPAFQPGHAHCDALAFELSCGRERIVTDTGVCEYIPGPLRDTARATRSHATIEVGGRDQAELWAAHRIGGRPQVRIESLDPGGRIVATCAGWATRRSVHRREFRAVPGGFEVTDRIEGPPQRARLALPLAPGLAPGLQGPRCELRLAGRRLHIDLPQGVLWRVESAACFPRFGEKQSRACLVGEGEGFREGTWRFGVS